MNKLNNMSRDLFTIEDETNPNTSTLNIIWPTTVLDQVFDQLSPTKKNLRQLLKDMKQEILTGGMGTIIFPVTSVNGKTEDVVIAKKDVGLGRVDNTKDIDKPLSTPQRNTIMDILKGYDFKINLDKIYEHMSDNNNPHSVTIDQMNSNEELTIFIHRLITAHSLSTERLVHIDSRRSLATLWDYVDENINGGLDEKLNNVLESVNIHLDDKYAHNSLFNIKEDIKNKSVGFTSVTGDHIKYPSTLAVVEFVNEKFKNFKAADIGNYIIDIKTVNVIDELPIANSSSLNKAYIIRRGSNSQNNIAICRLNPDKTYSWEISSLGSVSNFNVDHFVYTANGLSIKMESIIDSILTESGDIDNTVSNILREYYTKQEIWDLCIRGIKILPGTMDGHFRYYINDDPSLMSDEIAIPGLKNLAYLEWITENEIRELAVHNRHLLSRSVDSRVIELNSVKLEHLDHSTFTPDLLKTKKGTMLGNIMNDDGTVHSVNLVQLGDLLRPIIGGWPDVNIPGIDTALPEVSPITWEPGVENIFLDRSIGIRFIGEISVLPNRELITILSAKLNSKDYKILDAGGSWRINTEDETDALLGGSNITGHTYASVTMRKHQLELSTLSTGDRFKAPYDIWVRCIKR